jgi:hypothetical protein
MSSRQPFATRWILFSCAFLVSMIASSVCMGIVYCAVFVRPHFLGYLRDYIRENMPGELIFLGILSPVVGLFFAWLGDRNLPAKSICRTGIDYGALSYFVAYFFSMLPVLSWKYAFWFQQPFGLTVLFGLPFALILGSRMMPKRAL